MRIGIFYASKTGTTEKCAKELAKQLDGAEIYDLTKGNTSIDQYDVIVVGSAIRIGQLHKKVKNFLNENAEKLRQKHTAYFICNGNAQETNNVFEQNLSTELREHAICYESFGGEIILEKQKGIDKLIIKMIMKNPDSKLPEINYSSIRKFASEIKKIVNN
ncbi:MAG: hypothetical protein GX306_13980 [Clostridiales bacterium]|jgi:menaquinone-dependent protoporphyrinogen oxidase|nr:hypothetical protein [Clostridiales bacterium]